MGERWDDQVGEPTTPAPSIQRGEDGSLWPPASGGPAVVDGHISHATETAPQPPVPYGGYPSAPYGGMYPSAPYGGYPGMQPPREPSTLAQPFPIWLTIAAPLVMLVTVALAFGAEVLFLGADWATGAMAASLAAFALALVTVIVLIVRVIAGRRALGTVALSALLALTLVGAGLGGISQLNPLRSAQARQFEAARQWQAAINEYAQTGERAPNAPDIARVYTEWGEALSSGNDYAGAAAKLSTVVQTYAQSGAIVTRARADLYTVYVAWIRSGATTLPFQQSLTFLASYSSDPACDSSCQQTIMDVSGQAHYQYGEQLLNANQYKQAITEFEVVQSQYATSQYAQQAHLGAAKAYLALAQQTLTQDCASAVPYYQTLAKSYGDTDQGKQAKAKLAAPVAVSGVLTSAPGNPAPVVYLSRRISPKQYYASEDYRASLNVSSGQYRFASVKPGVYYLTTLRTTSTQIIYTWYVDSSNNPAPIQVGPVCATDIGTLKY